MTDSAQIMKKKIEIGLAFVTVLVVILASCLPLYST